MKDKKSKDSKETYNWEIRHLGDLHPDVNSIKIKNIPEPKGVKVDPEKR